VALEQNSDGRIPGGDSEIINTTLLVSSSSNRLAVMLENVLCMKGFERGGDGFAKRGEVERNGLVGCGERIE